MRKILLISALSFMFFNCEKEEEITNSNQRIVIGTITTFYDNGGNDYGCSGAPTDCVPEIIVTPKGLTKSFQSTIAPLINAINIQDVGRVQTIFRDNQADLLNYFEQQIIDDLLNGNLTLRLKSDTINQEYYFIFDDLSGNVARVYPVFV